jgi:RNA polymerase primary sigma factor
LEPEKEPTVFELELLEEETMTLQDSINLNDSLSVFLKDISQINLLTRDEEIDLAKKISSGLNSTDEMIIQLGKEARDKMIVSNLRLVVSVAKKFSFSNLSLMDLIQEGTLGLMKAVDRFDVDKGFKFSTYATWWIRQSISRSISNHSKTIRVPVHVYDMLFKVRKVMKKYFDDHGIKPDIETVSIICGIPVSTLRLIYLYTDDTISLDIPIGDGNSTLNDSTKDTNNPNPEEWTRINELEEYVLNIIEVLDDRERIIIKMRFGIDCEEKTLAEIGQTLGITRERVRQLEKKGIDKLRKLLNENRN